jgi:hypothetical protein
VFGSVTVGGSLSIDRPLIEGTISKSTRDFATVMDPPVGLGVPVEVSAAVSESGGVSGGRTKVGGGFGVVGAIGTEECRSEVVVCAGGE